VSAHKTPLADVTLAERFLDGADADAVDELRTGTPPEASAAYVEIVALVIAMNAAVHKPDASRSVFAEAGINADVLERLKDWIEKLREKLAEIAVTLGVKSYSITAGTGVWVTIEFGP
jgi:deferrochelatase/peroxidase EfeB